MFLKSHKISVTFKISFILKGYLDLKSAPRTTKILDLLTDRGLHIHKWKGSLIKHFGCPVHGVIDFIKN